MEISQKLELKHLLIPALAQSLKVLSLSQLELAQLVKEELENNPFLEETQNPPPPAVLSAETFKDSKPDPALSLATAAKKVYLQDILLRQLGMFTETDQEYLIGEEIIGNIDENGYLKTPLEEIAKSLNITLEKTEKTLKLIQNFEPAGVGARTVSECLLIQLKNTRENNPLLLKLAERHLENIAKKNYRIIAKDLKEPLENIKPLINKLLKLDPKPGRNYSAEEIQRVVPDITIELKDTGSENGSEEIEITINNEDIPAVNLNNTYKEILKNNGTDPETREFLAKKVSAAEELLRAISKRKATLRKITEAVTQIQREAIINGLKHLKPLTFLEVAQKIDIHESTVSRAVMNKYVKLPCGIITLKELFPSRIPAKNGQHASSKSAKIAILEIIEQEDKKRPLSDQDISEQLSKENGLNISRRTVAKYREELKIISTAFRREK